MTLTIHTFKDRESLFKNEHIFVKLKFAIQIDKLVFTLKRESAKLRAHKSINTTTSITN